TLLSAAAETLSLGCDVAVTGSGRVWAAWWDKNAALAKASWSDTAGRRWSKIVTLGAKATSTTIDDGVVGHRISLAADPTAGSTRTVAAWATRDTAGTSASTRLATTDGTSWSQPRSVSDPAVTITRQPAVALGSDDQIALGYYNQAGSTIF